MPTATIEIMKSPCSPFDGARIDRCPVFSKAFTLTELLVAVTIIAVVATVAFSASSVVRVKTRTFKCCNNLRQIGTAFHLYAQDHQATLPGPIPSVQRSHTSRSAMGTPASLVDYLAPYLGLPQLLAASDGQVRVKAFECPASYEVFNYPNQNIGCYIQDSNPAPGVRFMPFGYKSAGVETTLPMRLPAIGDAHAIRALMDDDYRSGAPISTALKGPAHGTERNVLFVDGHAETCRSSTLP